MHLFYAKTSEGWTIKTIADHLKLCVKTNGEFRINEHGMCLRQMSGNKHLLTEVDLRRDDGGFDGGYEYNGDEDDEFVGMNLVKLQQTLKNIKKKDAIEMIIDKEDQTKMTFVIHSVGKTETCELNIYKAPRRVEKEVEGYSHPMTVLSTDFQKMIKKLSSMDATVKIRVQGSNYASFFADDKSLANSRTEFGTFDPKKKYYEESFYVADLKNSVKMPAMSRTIGVYAPITPRYPIRFHTKAGSLGNVNTYIKDVLFIEAEKVQQQKNESS